MPTKNLLLNKLKMDAWSNWKSEDGKSISSILNIVEKIPADNDNEILTSLDEEKSLILSNSEVNGDCSLYINVNQSDCEVAAKTLNFVTDILIVSEAKTVETFTNTYQEYYKTFQSVLISDLQDSKIYKTFITFSKPQKYVELKLKSLFCKETVWIYGIFLKVMTDITSSVINSLECSATRLDSILKEKNVILSQKAENFKKLYSIFNVSQKLENAFSLEKDSSEISKNYQSKDLETLKKLGGTEITSPVIVENSFLKDTNINPDLHVGNNDYQKNFEKFGYENLLINKMKDLISQTKPTYYPSHLQHLFSTLPHENNVAIQNTKDVFRDEVYDGLPTIEGHDDINRNLISSILEPLIDKKLNELEIKMKVQIENSNRVILNKLSQLETLLMKIVDDKNNC